MNRLYKLCALALAAALCLTLAACGPAASSSSAPSSSAPSSSASSGAGSASAPSASGSQSDALSDGQRYAYAIRDARPAEDNDYLEIVATLMDGTQTLAVNPNGISDEDAASSIQMMLDTLGLDASMLDAYAFSMSLMNVRAYAIGIFKPAEGQTDAVKSAVENYVSLQNKAFENYLPDQYEVAKGALIETLPSGEVVLVMSEGAADILSGIQDALQ